LNYRRQCPAAAAPAMRPTRGVVMNYPFRDMAGLS